MYPQLEGGFGSMRVILPLVRHWGKNGSKTKTKRDEIELSF